MPDKLYNNTAFKILAGIITVGGTVFLIQWISGFFPLKPPMNNELFFLIISIIQCVVSVWCYILIYRFFEKRQIIELSFESFLKSAIPGFLAGIVLQSLIILILYFAGGYLITRINPASFMLPALTAALTAGFVAEIIIRGIVFRLIERRLGTVLSICIMMLLFVILHMGGKGATILSVMAVSMQTGFLLSAVYVLTRNLWFPIFLHFAWDFAEPGIFGAINPGNSIEKSLFSCQVSGPDMLTGGSQGPVNSIQALLLCLLTGLFFLWLAKRRKQLILPYWNKSVDL
jgi:uncharacterized protein